MQLPAVHSFVHPDAADAALAEDAKDVRKRGVIVEIETQPGGIHEDELTLHAQLDLPLNVEQMLGGGQKLVQRRLHLRVLDRIELERAKRRIEDDQKVSPGVTQESVRRLHGLDHRRATGARLGHAPTSRRARMTAFLTRGSLSSVAVSRAARASGERIFPNAMAAQARVSEDLREYRHALRPGERAVGLIKRHLLGEIGGS